MSLNSFVSEVKVIDSEIWVSWNFATDLLRVSLGAIKKGVLRQRKSNSTTWINRKDPTDKRKNLVLLTSIPKRYNPPSEDQVWALLLDKERQANNLKRDRKQDYLVTKILDLLPALSKRDSDVFDSYVIEQPRVDFDTGELVYDTKGSLPADKLKELQARCMFYSLLVSDDKLMLRKRFDEEYHRPADFRTLVVKASKQYELAYDVKLKLSDNDQVLLRNIKRYEQEGAGMFLSQYGNTNSLKYDVDDDQMIIKLMSDPRKPTVKDACATFNRIRVQKGKEEVKIRSFRDRVNLPSIQYFWYAIHHGFSAWQNKFEHTNITFKPSVRNALWVADGTKVNYYYREGGKTKARLDVYVILDAHSERILGYSFSTNGENAYVIREALSKSIASTGNTLPYQLLYDGDSANKLAFQGASEVMVAFNAKARNPKSKIIESVFGRMQRYIMSRHINFTGQNVLAKSDRSRLNVDKLEKYQKTFGTLAEAMSQFEEDMRIWNALKQGVDDKSPNERYNDSPDYVDFRWLGEKENMHLFWEYKVNDRMRKQGKLPSFKEASDITFYNHGIALTFGKKTFNYEVLDTEGEIDQRFLQKYTGLKFKVKYNVNDLDKKRIALFNENQKFIAWATSTKMTKRAIYDFEEGDKDLIERRLKTRREQRKEVMDKQEDLNYRYDGHQVAWNCMSKEEQSLAESDYLEELASTPSEGSIREGENQKVHYDFDEDEMEVYEEEETLLEEDTAPTEADKMYEYFRNLENDEDNDSDMDT
ncbi:hypothetical protein [Flammeovirga sp. SJP92]|uniref:hypothetical protein n=1 Tax=Flammeovirga sp. SJP92 TaxID=1775430 RepID=UPI0007889B96|nr:hypothetical protein [Flammeovirga sp. SJP92]KXX70624.1 hypothetical protein AVL50_07320 [Flammeovirga sp. SJP92]